MADIRSRKHFIIIIILFTEENCVDPAITLGRQLNSYTITKMLETEKDLYKQLIEALIVCEKGKLSTKTATPTTSPTTMQMTTTPATTTSATTSEATTQGGWEILLDSKL